MKPPPDPWTDHPGPTLQLLGHAETIELPATLAGQPPVRKRAPAHRRLAKGRRIPPEVETEIEHLCIAWEMVEGGAHEPGAGGDRQSSRDEVYTRAALRIAAAKRRAGPAGLALAVASCVECWPAYEVAHRALGHPLPPGATLASSPYDWRQAAREALDRALIPVLHRLAGIPLDTPRQSVPSPVCSPELRADTPGKPA